MKMMKTTITLKALALDHAILSALAVKPSVWYYLITYFVGRDILVQHLHTAAFVLKGTFATVILYVVTYVHVLVGNANVGTVVR
jgi:hypothetical protein